MSPVEIEKSMVSIDFGDKPAKVNLNKSFPQIVTRKNTIRKSDTKAKYSLKDAIKKVQLSQNIYDRMLDMGDMPCLRFFSVGGAVHMSHEATLAMMEIPDVLILIVEAGWIFTIVEPAKE